MMSRFIVITAIFALLIGCDASTSTSSSGGGSDDSDDSKVLAASADKNAVEELGKSKLPAKAWLMDTKHGTFKAKKTDVLKLADDCIAAGAIGVWMGEVKSLEDKQLADHLFIELPTDAAKRSKVFEVYNKDVPAITDEPRKELGQKYVVLFWG